MNPLGRFYLVVATVLRGQCPCRRHALVLFLFLVFASKTTSQVNTEFLRRDATSQGLGGQIGMGLAYNAGNTSFLRLSLAGRLDYLAGAFYTFAVASFERGRKSNDLFLNNGFLHLRGVYTLDSAVRLELFAQREFNDFILLRDRQLAGAGLRLTLLDLPIDSTGSLAAHLGVGGMIETELYKAPIERTDLVRTTNYLSVAWRLKDRVNLGVVGYYQAAISDIADFRLLCDGGLGFEIFGALIFNVAVRYRYDNQPPPEVERYDLGIANGVTVKF